MVGNPLIKKYRTDRGLSQEALGRELGVTGVTIFRWERGDRQISRSILKDISEKTGIPARELRPDIAELIEV